MVKKDKKKNIIKIVVTVAGILSALAAITALVAFFKKRAEKKRETEAKIEEEIRVILEDKLAESANEEFEIEIEEEPCP